MNYKHEFIRFLSECGVLKFGTFTLKSGRVAPYFLNAGEYKTGAQIKRLGEFYAACIMEHKIPVQTLFGPAYKGVPLALAAAVALHLAGDAKGGDRRGPVPPAHAADQRFRPRLSSYFYQKHLSYRDSCGCQFISFCLIIVPDTHFTSF